MPILCNIIALQHVTAAIDTWIYGRNQPNEKAIRKIPLEKGERCITLLILSHDNLYTGRNLFGACTMMQQHQRIDLCRSRSPATKQYARLDVGCRNCITKTDHQRTSPLPRGPHCSTQINSKENTYRNTKDWVCSEFDD